jgi:hypothetical protein
MSEPQRQPPQSKGPALRNPVPIARGYGRDALARVVAALTAAGIPHEINADPDADSPGGWNVRVPITSAPRAIAALAALGAETTAPGPGASHGAGEPPHPLFESSSGPLLRALVVALCFGLAIWLALFRP